MIEKTAFAKKFAKKKDIAILLALLAIALAAWLIYSGIHKTGDRPCAKLFYNGELIETMYLDRDRQYVPKQSPEVEIEVRDGAVMFSHSNCLDKICVNSGRLSYAGDFAACLPNGLSLWVEGGSLDIADKNAVNIE